MKSLIFLAIFIFHYNAVFAAHNVTIDDPNSLIAYAGSWSQVSSSLAAGGSHAYSQDSTATATFTFTGVAIYYMASKWPYPVNTLVTLDSGTPSVIDLTDHSHNAPSGTGETMQSSVVWGQNGLANTQHTLRASMASGGSFVVMDTLIYTVLDPSDAPSSAPSNTKSPVTQHTSTSSHSPSATTTPKHGSSRTPTAVIAGIVVGLLVVAILAVTVLFLCRRRQKSSSTPDVYVSPYANGSAQAHSSVSPFLNPGVPSQLSTSQYAQSNTSFSQMPISSYGSSSRGPPDSYGYAAHQHLEAPLAQSDMASPPPTTPTNLPTSYGYQPTHEPEEAWAQSETALFPGGLSNPSVSSIYPPVHHQMELSPVSPRIATNSPPGGVVTPHDSQPARQQNETLSAPSGMAPRSSAVSFDPYASIGNALIEPTLSSPYPQNAGRASSIMAYPVDNYPNIPATPGSGNPFLDGDEKRLGTHQRRQTEDYAPPAYSPI